MDIRFSCSQCQKQLIQSISWPVEGVSCEACQKALFPHATEAFINHKRLDQCPICGAAHLYRRKDFNQKLGIFLVVIGVVLAYFTYGISLLVVTLIDFFLLKKIGEVGICYQCKTEFRHSGLVDDLPPFDLELFDYYRNLKKP